MPRTLSGDEYAALVKRYIEDAPELTDLVDRLIDLKHAVDVHFAGPDA